jgi:hypothetical protein
MRGLRNRIRGVALTLLLVVAGPAPSWAVTEADVENYLQAFYEILLFTTGQNPGEGNQPQPKALAKFTQPMRIRFIGPEVDHYRGPILQMARRLAGLAGLEFVELAPNDDSENLLVEMYYTRPSDNFRCRAAIGTDARGQRRGHVFIHPPAVTQCATHEIMHTMGFSHDYGKFGSVMSYVYRTTDLSPLDRILVRVLYDPRLKHGMRWIPAITAARDALVDKLIADGAPPATAEMGRRFVRNFPEMMKREFAEKGNVEIQAQLGYAYTFAEAIPKDEIAGYYWFRRAAETGHAGAQANVGVSLLYGRGVSADPPLGIPWLRRAAAQGHGGAIFNLGTAYRDGRGVPSDPVEAYKWLAVAAAQRAPGADANLQRLVPQLTAAQIEEGKRRAGSWKPDSP